MNGVPECYTRHHDDSICKTAMYPDNSVVRRCPGCGKTWLLDRLTTERATLFRSMILNGHAWQFAYDRSRSILEEPIVEDL